ncbi:hypothetical protein HF325_000367 [Metschnikowia pulcherrima]|uniref:Uncharacterized protein n=1 Tax=Metschnikowia pulcherrima TaxID=27326 RepID=A0A8H7GW74_9ASCO|nr:hypothetical protein HF325_000367 [Metschnikowia pulcherrima]
MRLSFSSHVFSNHFSSFAFFCGTLFNGVTRTSIVTVICSASANKSSKLGGWAPWNNTVTLYICRNLMWALLPSVFTAFKSPGYRAYKVWSWKGK